jgi:hypothetical protein
VVSETCVKLTVLATGHCVVQIRLIFLVAPPRGGESLRGLESFLAYVERFDLVPQPMSLAPAAPRIAGRNPVTQMYVLKRASRAGLRRFGDIVPLSQLRGPVQLVPCFGEVADPRLAVQNSLHYSNEFWLNSYANKEIFWALRF